MNPKIEKLAKDIEKTKAKIAEQQARLRDLEKQKTELENTDFCGGGPQLPPEPQGTGRILKKRGRWRRSLSPQEQEEVHED